MLKCLQSLETHMNDFKNDFSVFLFYKFDYMLINFLFGSCPQTDYYSVLFIIILSLFIILHQLDYHPTLSLIIVLRPLSLIIILPHSKITDY